MNADAQNPWLGLVSYSEDDNRFFHGRGRETQELLALIQRDTLTVLYGVSGLGKTSLLQAGVFPELRKHDYLPVAIRLDHDWEAIESVIHSILQTGTSGVLEMIADPTWGSLGDQVLGALEKAGAHEKVTVPGLHGFTPSEYPLTTFNPEGQTLWEYFHREDHLLWNARNRPLTPVLVFDQFEEIFTQGQKTAARAKRLAAFLDELSHLVENRPPPRVTAAVERGESVPFNFEQVPMRVVLSLREDFLPPLSALRKRFPTIRQNELRLLPLKAAQAREVIERPGSELLGPGFVDALLEFLTRRDAQPDSKARPS